MKAWMIELGVGVDYTGIWLVEYLGDCANVITSRSNGVRARIKKLQMVWWACDEHKPAKHPKEPEIINVAKSRLCFTKEELNKAFESMRSTLLEGCYNQLLVDRSNVKLYEQKIANIEKEIRKTEQQIISLCKLKLGLVV